MAKSVSIDDALEAAIDWTVVLRSGEATPMQQQRFEQWLMASPQHVAAWERVSGQLARSIAPLRRDGRAPLAERALLAPRLSRRRMLRGTLAIAYTAGGAFVANRYMPLSNFAADLRTGTGERRTATLPDGSTVTLNARSAIDIDFRAGQRRIALQAGEVIVDCHPGSARPLAVIGGSGELRATGGRFLLRRTDTNDLAVMLAGAASARTQRGDETLLRAGESRRIAVDGFGPLLHGQADRAAWLDGMLAVHNEPLGEVIDAVRAYRPGLIRITPAAAGLRVLGAFPLDDTDKLLGSLAQTLPIQITTWRGGWLVAIDVAPRTA